MEEKPNIESVSNDEFLNRCNEMLNDLREEYLKQKRSIKNLIKLHEKEIKNIQRKKTKEKNRKSGIESVQKIPDSLAKLIDVEMGSCMSRIELSKRVIDVLKKRGLVYPKDKRVYRVDDEIMKIFNLSENVNSITDCHNKNGFNMFNLQKHVAKCFN